MKGKRRIVICPHCGDAFMLTKRKSLRRDSAINYVLTHPQINSLELADKIGVSQRQAQYYLKYARDILRQYGRLVLNLENLGEDG